MTANASLTAKIGLRGIASRTILALALLGPALAAQEQPAQEPAPAEVAPEQQPVPVAEDVRARLSTLFEGHLLDTRNGQDFVETQGYRRLLETLQNYSPQEIHARIEGDLSFEEALKNPDAWRGRFVRVRGLLGGYEAVRQREPIGRNVDIYRGAVATRWPGRGPEENASEGVVFDLLEPPAERIASQTLVDVEGIFYRTVRYENVEGNIQEAPYVLARTLQPVNLEAVEKSHALDWTGMILIGAAVAYIVGRVLFSLSRKQARRPESRGSGLQEALRKRHLHSDRPR